MFLVNPNFLTENQRYFELFSFFIDDFIAALPNDVQMIDLDDLLLMVKEHLSTHHADLNVPAHLLTTDILQNVISTKGLFLSE